MVYLYYIVICRCCVKASIVLYSCLVCFVYPTSSLLVNKDYHNLKLSKGKGKGHLI